MKQQEWIQTPVLCLSVPALCVLWWVLLALELRSFPLDRAASLVGICCCTVAGFCTWLVVLIRWMGSSVFTGWWLMLSLRGGTFGGVSEEVGTAWSFGGRVLASLSTLPLNDWWLQHWPQGGETISMDVERVVELVFTKIRMQFS